MHLIQDGLFPPPPATEVRRPAKAAATGRPRWSKYRPAGRVQCDHCVLRTAEGDPTPIRAARWRRQLGQGDLVLCDAHAQLQRDLDHLPKLKG